MADVGLILIFFLDVQKHVQRVRTMNEATKSVAAAAAAASAPSPGGGDMDLGGAAEMDAARSAQTLTQQQRAAVLIQSRFRGHRQRQLYKETVTTVLKIQQLWRRQHRQISSSPR